MVLNSSSNNCPHDSNSCYYFNINTRAITARERVSIPSNVVCSLVITQCLVETFSCLLLMSLVEPSRGRSRHRARRSLDGRFQHVSRELRPTRTRLGKSRHGSDFASPQPGFCIETFPYCDCRKKHGTYWLQCRYYQRRKSLPHLPYNPAPDVWPCWHPAISIPGCLSV
jgi:hypothetical protein